MLRQCSPCFELRACTSPGNGKRHHQLRGSGLAGLLEECEGGEVGDGGDNGAGSDTDPRNATFSVADEDHTLGNSLRFVLNEDPLVAFCDYSVPHPSENRIYARVQPTGVPARDDLKDVLNDLTAMNQHMMTTFERAVERFKANQGMTELISMKSGVISQHFGSVKNP